MLRVSPQEAEPRCAAHPRQEGFFGSRRSRVLAQAHRRREEVPRERHRQRREQPQPRRGRSRRQQAYVGKALVMKRFHAGPWPWRPHHEALLEPHDRGSGSCRSRRKENQMGQKVNPIGLRLGINRTWDSRWFAGKGEYAKLMHEDMAIREALMKQLKQAAVSKIVIERPHKKCRVTIHSRPSGRGDRQEGRGHREAAQARRQDDERRRGDQHRRGPQAGSRCDAGGRLDRPAARAPRRVRRAMKRAVQSAMRLGAEGIRINCSGRLGGAETPPGMVPRGPRSAAHAACGRGLRHRHGLHDLWHLRDQRSGSSRAKSLSTIRWLRTSG